MLGAVQLYGLLMLIACAFGPRVYPHRLGGGMLELRLGQLYVVRIPVAQIERAEHRVEKVEPRPGSLLRDREALLPARGRVDLRLELKTPVELERPLGEPVSVSAISVAVDDPRALLAQLEQMQRAPTVLHETNSTFLGWLAPVGDLLDAATA